MASSPLFAYDMPDNGGFGLYSSVNAFNTGEAQKPFAANLPNYLTNLQQGANNTTQQLKGQLPDDVINQIAQQAAERGVANGSPTSPNSRAAYLKALGLNSLQMMQQGQQNFSKQIEDTPVPQIFNPASLIVPERLASIELGAAMNGRNAGRGGGGMNVGMPSLTAPTRDFSTRSMPNVMASGPSWGTGPVTDTTTLSNNWWNTYGQPAGGGGQPDFYDQFLQGNNPTATGGYNDQYEFGDEEPASNTVSDYDWFD